jgi:hypothetical protein
MKGTSSIGFDGKLGRHFSLRTTTNSPPRLYEPRVKGLESIALFARNSSVHLVRMPPMLTADADCRLQYPGSQHNRLDLANKGYRRTPERAIEYE